METPGDGRSGFEMAENFESGLEVCIERIQDRAEVEEKQEVGPENEKPEKGHPQAVDAAVRNNSRDKNALEEKLELNEEPEKTLDAQVKNGSEELSEQTEKGPLDLQKRQGKNDEAGVDERAREDGEARPGTEVKAEEQAKSPGEGDTGDAGEGFESSLPRNLSSPDRTIREKALALLGEWLASCKQVEEAQLVPIWKSLLFLVWHTTKGPAQVELSKSITLILGRLTPEPALITFKVFLSIMVKEWSGIDKKRIEKFRSLLQLCLRQVFSLLELQGWDETLTRRFVDVVGTTEGVNVFLLQAYLQELRSFVPPTPEVLRLLLEPFFVLSVNCSSKVVLQKMRDSVFLPLLQEARAALMKQGQSEAAGEEKKSLGSLVLALSMGSKFSELSASPSVAPNNKKLLQQLYEEFTRSEKPLPGLRPLKKPKAREEEEAALSSSSPESMTGRKRKRVNAGDAPPVEHRRVLRSEKKILAQQQQEWDPVGDPVVLNLEEKLSLLGDPRSDDEAKSEKTTTTTSSGPESEAEQQQQLHAAKRVRFSLRNNIIWAPHKPLPPQWVRVPPCAAPRGSAMKAGVLPGPVAQSSSACAPKASKKERGKKKKKKKSGAKSGKRKSATPPRSKRLKSG